MLALVLTATLAFANGSAVEATTGSRTTSAAHTAAARQATIIARLVRRGDPAAVEYVVVRVARGLPPSSLEAFLDGAALAPRPAYVAPLRALTAYRKAAFRAKALIALAAQGQGFGAEAAIRAMDDPALEIRLLGLQLAERHTSPRTEEAAILLLDRDREIADIVRRSRSGG